jgi:predicted glycosyltransferase
MRVFFYVQNLLGVGHIFRALRISRALVEDGFEVDLVLGGRPIPGLDTGPQRIVQLPAISAGPGGFGDLIGPHGRPLDEAGKRARRDALFSAFEATRPDIVLIEAYPFGRRQMRFELEPLLETVAAMGSRPLVVSSIRDILQEQKKPGRNEEAVATLRRHFDHVIVHGDPALVRLEGTFPLAGAIADMTSYSGMVAPAPLAGRRTSDPRYGAVVSVGGGAVGRAVLEVALRAKPRTTLSGARWLAITGTNLAGSDAAAIKELAVRNEVEIARFVPDLPQVLAAARLSISQAGYNSVADILRAGTRAVLVPFAAAGETEQTRRASLLAGRGLAVAMPEAGLDADTMAKAIERSLALAPAAGGIDLEGAPRTAQILRRLAGRRGA